MTRSLRKPLQIAARATVAALLAFDFGAAWAADLKKVNEVLSNAEYQCAVQAGEGIGMLGEVGFKLTDGKYTAPPDAPDDIAGSSAGIYPNLTSVGDLGGDGEPDAVAVIWDSGGGSGAFFSMYVVEDVLGDPRCTHALFLGDRVDIWEVRIEPPATIAVDFKMHGPEQGMADLPALRVRRRYRLGDESVEPSELQPDGEWTTSNSVAWKVSLVPNPVGRVAVEDERHMPTAVASRQDVDSARETGDSAHVSDEIMEVGYVCPGGVSFDFVDGRSRDEQGNASHIVREALLVRDLDADGVQDAVIPVYTFLRQSGARTMLLLALGKRSGGVECVASGVLPEGLRILGLRSSGAQVFATVGPFGDFEGEPSEIPAFALKPEIVTLLGRPSVAHQKEGAAESRTAAKPVEGDHGNGFLPGEVEALDQIRRASQLATDTVERVRALESKCRDGDPAACAQAQQALSEVRRARDGMVATLLASRQLMPSYPKTSELFDAEIRGPFDANYDLVEEFHISRAYGTTAIPSSAPEPPGARPLKATIHTVMKHPSPNIGPTGDRILMGDPDSPTGGGWVKLNDYMTDLRVFARTDGKIEVRFKVVEENGDIRWPAQVPVKVLIRLFDGNGEYLTHVTSAESFAPRARLVRELNEGPLAMLKRAPTQLLGLEDNQLVYAVNERDLDYTKMAEVGFLLWRVGSP